MPKKWEAKYSDVLTAWEIIGDGLPSIRVQRALARDYPTDLDDYVTQLQAGGHFAYGVYWDTVTEKGKLAGGFYVVGKVKLKGTKEAKGAGVSLIHDLGGEIVIVKSFSSYYDDAKLLREAIEICEGAKY